MMKIPWVSAGALQTDRRSFSGVRKKLPWEAYFFRMSNMV